MHAGALMDYSFKYTCQLGTVYDDNQFFKTKAAPKQMQLNYIYNSGS